MHNTTPNRHTRRFAPRTEPPEASPSAGWREVCVALGVDPDATAVPADGTTHAAVYDDDRTARNRRKHALGGTS